MLPKDRDDEFPATRRKRDNPDAPVFRALNTAHESFAVESVNRFRCGRSAGRKLANAGPEAGGDDLKPDVLITENWYFNQGGEMDWNFTAEPSPAVNNRSIHQAMGKAFGGGTSINGMVWAPHR